MKPMKAYSKTPDLSELTYPLLASTKLDGIRCIIDNGVALSNQLKPIPNKHVQAWAKEHAELLQGLDGELMCRGDFNDVQSGIMAVDGTEMFEYHVFDLWNIPNIPFTERRARACSTVRHAANFHLFYVEQHLIKDADQLQKMWEDRLALGYEGVIARSINGPYKYGRSTLKQGWMIKLKKWDDAEAEIIGYEELETNTNDAFTGELGQTKRSHEKAGMVPAGTLGSLIVKWQGQTFNIGTGFDATQRDSLWGKRESLRGQAVTFKYFGVSKYGVPRHPVYKGIRYDV